MRDLTMMYSYYDNPNMLIHQQHKAWMQYPDEIKKRIVIKVVDDCSPQWPAVDAVVAGDPGYEFHLYHVLVDVPWNMDHARNLMASRAKTRWLFMSDMDHLLPVDSILSIFSLLDKGVFKEWSYYTFSRVDAPNRTPYKDHPNTYLMSRELYWKVGGYDESFAGFYGTDGHFRRALAYHSDGGMKLKGIDIIRYPRSVIADASTTTLDRKKGREREKSSKYKAMAKYNLENGIRPKVLSFPWEKLI